MRSWPWGVGVDSGFFTFKSSGINRLAINLLTGAVISLRGNERNEYNCSQSPLLRYSYCGSVTSGPIKQQDFPQDSAISVSLLGVQFELIRTTVIDMNGLPCNWNINCCSIDERRWIKTIKACSKLCVSHASAFLWRNTYRFSSFKH